MNGPKILIAIILITLGFISLTYEGIPFQTREKAIQLGPLEVTMEKTREIPLPPLFGTAAVIGGIFLLLWQKGPAPE